MSQLPKRESKLPEKFQAWKPGDSHAPYSIRNFKKKDKEDKVKVKKYQASYREKKKANSENMEPSVNKKPKKI